MTRSIGRGLLIYVSVERGDGEADVEYLAEKIRGLRIFSDEQGRMNLDVTDAKGALLVVSAFTVGADARRGRRPSFEGAAPGEEALVCYERLCGELVEAGMEVQRGSFGDHMDVESINDGPVCILLDSRRRF